MPNDRGSGRRDCADNLLTERSGCTEGEGGGLRESGPIAAGLCPELLAGCRRGCRPERDTPPPLSTRSA